MADRMPVGHQGCIASGKNTSTQKLYSSGSKPISTGVFFVPPVGEASENRTFHLRLTKNHLWKSNSTGGFFNTTACGNRFPQVAVLRQPVVVIFPPFFKFSNFPASDFQTLFYIYINYTSKFNYRNMQFNYRNMQFNYIIHLYTSKFCAYNHEVTHIYIKHYIHQSFHLRSNNYID